MALLACLTVAFILLSHRLLFDLTSLQSDIWIHYRWAMQFQQSLSEGTLYPRWMALANLGLGEPALMHYAPLYFYVVAATHGLTSDVWTAMKFCDLIALAGAGWIIYAVCRRSGFRALESLLAAVATEAAPFFSMNASYVNGTPWHFALPFAAAAVFLSSRRPPGDALVDTPLILAMFLVTVTHTLTAFMLIIVLPFANARHLADPTIPPSRRWKPFLRWALSMAIALGLSAFYLWPALTAFRYIRPEGWAGAVNWRATFAFPTFTAARHGLTWFAYQWAIAASLLLALLTATTCLWRSRARRDEPWLLLCALIAVGWAALLLSSEASYPFWIMLGPLRQLQYAYRFFYVLSLTAIPAVALAWDVCRKREPSTGRRNARLLPLLVSASLTVFVIAKTVSVDGTSVRAAIQERRYGGFGGEPEYATAERGSLWQAYAEQGGFDAFCRKHGVEAVEILSESEHRRWSVLARQPTDLVLPLFAYPAWHTSLDDCPLAAKTDPDTGLLRVDVDAGSHTLDVRWRALPQQRIGAILSFITLAVLLALARWSRVAHHARPPVTAA